MFLRMTSSHLNFPIGSPKINEYQAVNGNVYTLTLFSSELFAFIGK